MSLTKKNLHKLIDELSKPGLLTAKNIFKSILNDSPKKFKKRIFPEVMTPKQVADYLLVSEMYVRKILRARKIRASKVGKLWRVQKSDIIEFLNRTANITEEETTKRLADLDVIMTRKQAADYLQVSEKSIRKLIRTKKLKASKFSNLWRVQKKDIINYLNRRKKRLKVEKQ